jgi:hypothetical protein
VIHNLHAVVAIPTVFGPQRPVDVADRAVVRHADFHRTLHGIWREIAGNNAWIREGRQTEIDESDCEQNDCQRIKNRCVKKRNN